jgi:hypothetical protein
MSDISLFLDQDNELRFNVSIEGSKPGTPRYRLTFEGKNLSYTFRGSQSSAGEVCFVIPSMKNIIKEQNMHATLEVMIDDRYFAPLTFNAQFEESVKVVAESIVRPVQKKVGVSAFIVSSNKPAPAQSVQHLPEVSAPKSTPQTLIKNKNDSGIIGVMDGKKITAEDLRRILRSGGI